MDLDRPPHHRTPSASTTTTTPTGELFVCFTSRLSSSSSMKLSKSILSPGRARDPSVSLSTSLSRRLRSNGSIKAGQASPMFPSSAKKRGSAFENPEPSSPKVTCIGQVRVKTKKKVKHSRSLSTRRSGDLSFRKVEQAQDGMNLSEERDRLCLQNQRSSSVHYQQQECAPHRNQRWVHLPLTICEALRAEFSCLFPCRSSCFSTNEREKEEKGNGSKDNSHHNGQQQQQEQRSCGAVFARWLVAVQDGEGGKGREIELVVAGGDDEERITAGRPSTTMRSSRSRRHVFEDIDFKDESFVTQKGDREEEKEEEEKARVSICIPPKNALLLMRCRSDPMKMAALTNRFWETPGATKNEDSDGHGGEAVEKQEVEIQKGESKCEVVMEKECEEEVAEQNMVSSVNLEEDSEEETTMEMEVVSIEEEEAELKPEEEEAKELEVENQQEDSDLVSADSQIDQQNTENVEPDNPISEQDSGEEEGSITPLSTSSSPINSPEQASCETEEKIAPLPLEASVQEEYAEIDESEEEEEEEDELEEEGEEEEEESDTEIEYTTLKEELEKEEASEDDESVKKVSKKDILPECLLLMMCEPKLSMEVSKETWVCSTDFIRWLPERQQVKVSKTEASDNSKKRLSTDTKKSSGTNPTRPAPPPDNKNHHLLQPPRSSCSLPPRSSCSLPAAAVSGVSMASMIEQKLVNAVGYEPFVLTRCKSEPMRTAAKLAAAEPCFWKNRKLEPHRRATFGFGAAGVGF
ncbi:PREDICTED: FK506-binding protein 5-like isoform X2 [Ipomoea nil]|uniref:FK506-binding protein 5-like isoform X2 n=1 Tax=Ipomoea nil TaxID=35883 RepID=UPI0009015500|nr:PREDICTED: FK506-binding protein 5-like isoform X2 [Ipomoea nil]